MRVFKFGKWLTSTGSLHVGEPLLSDCTLMEAWPDVWEEPTVRCGCRNSAILSYKSDHIEELEVIRSLAVLSYKEKHAKFMAPMNDSRLCDPGR